MSVFNRNGTYQISLFFDVGRGKERLVISSGCSDKKAAAEMERKMGLLAQHRVAGNQPPPELVQWMERLPARLRMALVQKGIVDAHASASSEPIDQHLADYLDWCATVDSQSRTHVANKRTQINTVVRFMGVRRLSEVSREKMLSYQRAAKAKEEGNSHATVNRHCAAFNAFLNWCVEQQRLHLNPLTGIRRLNEEADRRRPRRPYTAEEVERLLDAAKPYRRLVYLFAVYTGLRRSELKRARVGNVDLENGVLRVPSRVDKEGESSVLPLHPALVEPLREYLRRRPDPREPLFDQIPRIQTLRRDLRRAGIERFNEEEEQLDFHALRTTLATEMIRAGVPLAKAALVTRHRSAKVLERHYVKLASQDAADALGVMPSFRTRGVVESDALVDPEAGLAGAVGDARVAERNTLATPLAPEAYSAAREGLEAAGTGGDRRDADRRELLDEGVAGETQPPYTAAPCGERRQPAADDNLKRRKSRPEQDLRAVGAVG